MKLLQNHKSKGKEMSEEKEQLKYTHFFAENPLEQTGI